MKTSNIDGITNSEAEDFHEIAMAVLIKRKYTVCGQAAEGLDSPSLTGTIFGFGHVSNQKSLAVHPPGIEIRWRPIGHNDNECRNYQVYFMKS